MKKKIEKNGKFKFIIIKVTPEEYVKIRSFAGKNLLTYRDIILRGLRNGKK